MINRIGVLFILLTLAIPFCAQADWRDRGLLFHAGFRPFLDADIQTGGISDDVWKTAIFGTTNFDLPEYRKGLYGATGFSGTSLYSLYQVLGGREPWVMAVQVKKSCLADSAMYDSEYSVRLTSGGGRFSDWYLKHRAKYRALEKLCLEDFGGFKNWKIGARYSVSEHDAVTQEETRKCTPVLNDFLNDEKIKLVFDTVNDDSWYIRDRDCIEGISGTPDQLLDLIFSNRIGDGDDLLDNLFGDVARSGTFLAGSTLMVSKILAETTYLDAAHAPAFADLLKSVDNYIGKDVEGPAITLDRNDDNAFILRRLFASAIGAIKARTAGDFQKRLQTRLNELTRVLSGVCQGAHGVPADRRDECSKATAAETKKLVDVLPLSKLEKIYTN